jgi:hypothetical protein
MWFHSAPYFKVNHYHDIAGSAQTLDRQIDDVCHGHSCDCDHRLQGHVAISLLLYRHDSRSNPSRGQCQ